MAGHLSIRYVLEKTEMSLA